MPRKTVSVQELLERATALNQIVDPELRVLKTHLVIEQMLTSLLALRLGVGEDQIPPNLSFSFLAELALAGSRYSAIKGKVRALNDLRNFFGHDVAAQIVSEQTGRFFKVFGFVYVAWPDFIDRGIAAACQRVAAEVWICISEWLIEMAPESSDASTLRDSIEEQRREFAAVDKDMAKARKDLKPLTR